MQFLGTAREGGEAFERNHRVSPRRWLKLCLLLTFTVLWAGCYESGRIVSIAVSPDGHIAAIINEAGEGSLIDLDAPQAEPVSFSRHAQPGLSWSPDGLRLAFVENKPGSTSELWILDREGNREAHPLVAGEDWKGSPVWLDPYTVAYLSDRGADYRRLWKVHVIAAIPNLMLDQRTDLRALVGSQVGGRLAFVSDASGSPEVWFYDHAELQPRQISKDLIDQPLEEYGLALDAAGEYLCFARPASNDQTQLVWRSLKPDAAPQSTTLAGRVSGTTLGTHQRVMAAVGEALIVWHPEGRWFGSDQQRFSLGQVGFGELASIGSEAALLAAYHGKLLLHAEDASDLEDSQLFASQYFDYFMLAESYIEHGESGLLRRLYKTMLKRAETGSEDDILLAISHARAAWHESELEEAEAWYRQARELLGSNDDDATFLWNELLAMTFFDTRDESAALDFCRKYPDGMLDEPFRRWCLSVLSEDCTAAERQRWQAIGRQLRRGQQRTAMKDFAAMVISDDWTTRSVVAVDLMLRDEWRPVQAALNQLDENETSKQSLLSDPTLVPLLRDLCRRKFAQGPAPEVLRGELLVALAKAEETEQARRLVLDDLAEAEPILDYLGFLHEFMVFDEIEPWLMHAMGQVLLAPEASPALERALSAPVDRLWLELVRTKMALLDENAVHAREALAKVHRALQSPEAQRLSMEEVIPAGVTALILEAKTSELETNWTEALRAYRQALALMTLYPYSWDLLGLEVGRSIALIEAGTSAPEELAALVRQIRAMGDPLLNPLNSQMSPSAMRTNLRTLEQYLTLPALLPHLQYLRAHGYARLGMPWDALREMRRLRRANAPVALLPSIFYEEASIREQLGQLTLAHQLYGSILNLPTPTPVRATALQAVLQSGRAGGLIDDEAAELDHLLSLEELPQVWNNWLWWQIGVPR